jgi:sulfopyruvate decarboxylase subunit alpha
VATTDTARAAPGIPGTGPDLIVEQFRDCGIACVTSVVDAWSVPLMQRFDAADGIRHIRVAREVDTVGITAGAFFAGVPSAAVIGISGLLTCFHEFATFNLAHQLPMFILGIRRGGLDDPWMYHMQQATFGLAALEALGVYSNTIDSCDELDRIPEAYERSRLLKKPYVCFVTKRVLRHGMQGASL